MRVFRVVNIAVFLPMSAIRIFLGSEAVFSDEEEATILHFQQDHALQRLEAAPLRAPGVEMPTRVVMSQ
jgi:hypothetical protein